MLPDTQNQQWVKDTSKFGYQMLLKMGWKEGKGLGKNQQGDVNHVKVEKREESLGMGVETDSAGNKAYLGQIQNFNDLLASLNNSNDDTIVTKSEKVKTKKKKKSGSKKLKRKREKENTESRKSKKVKAKGKSERKSKKGKKTKKKET
mmetsp:Transcript_1792/g.2061  ORF Transcript_1792/g.2061 Transcript_1792/m.2061 type:complete len:148 (+) Transcript_1792:111-554(+)